MGLYPEPLNLSKNKDIRLKSPVDRLRQDILGSGDLYFFVIRCLTWYFRLLGWVQFSVLIL